MIQILETLPSVYLGLYIALGVAFLVQGFWAWSAGRRSVTLNWVVAGLFAAALGMHLFHFFTRWYINGHAPLQSKHEVFTCTGLSTMIFALVLYLSERVWRNAGAAAVLSNIVFFLLTGCGGVLWTLLGMKEDYKIHNLVPALQSYWHAPHVAAYMLGYGSLGLASILALFYVFGAVGKWLGGGPVFENLASPLVDKWIYKVAGYGFPFMTAALCMGALWADDSWGTYWFWDAKETWALISWAFFLIYFHVRFVRGWVGLRAQLLVLGGGLMILITYVLIHVLPASQASLHVYN
ncbi:MAG: cytochrome c biogenesis protein CcsA [Planctomycetota bacterium]|jgi:ABC-type transport system involved in cytochrome c biogenesis permease subunit